MKHVDPNKILVIDIETATEYPDYDSMPDAWKALWKGKIGNLITETNTPALLYRERGAVMAEFARIVCISTGYFFRNQNLFLKIRSFFDSQEARLLEDFLAFLNQVQQNQTGWCFGGHNIREFDIPFICRRLLANEIPIPTYLDFQQMKPWETNLVDSFQYWRFGDYKNFTSLHLLASVLKVPGSKDDMDGSMVGQVYWQNESEQEKIKSVRRIVRYCEKDIETSSNVLLRLMNIPILHEKDVIRELPVEDPQIN